MLFQTSQYCLQVHQNRMIGIYYQDHLVHLNYLGTMCLHIPPTIHPQTQLLSTHYEKQQYMFTECYHISLKEVWWCFGPHLKLQTLHQVEKASIVIYFAKMHFDLNVPSSTMISTCSIVFQQIWFGLVWTQNKE